MSDSPEGAEEAELDLRDLGAALAELRRRSGVTGEALGERLGMSQAKISKIERGVVRVTPHDTERIAAELGASGGVLADLVARAVRMEGARRARSTPPPEPAEEFGHGQREFAAHELKARRIRSFEVVGIPGLLQISEYARRVINSVFELTYGDAEPRWVETARAVSLRAQRQEQLYQRDRAFEFVINEAALSLQLLTPGYMLAQVDRLQFAAELPNVTIRIVSSDAELLYPLFYGFTILDESAVLSEIGHTPILLRDRENIDLHIRLFEHYAELASSDPLPLLMKYKAIYADAARPKD